MLNPADVKVGQSLARMSIFANKPIYCE